MKRLSTILLKAQDHRRALVVAGIIFASILAGIWLYYSSRTTTYYIAYIGRYKRENFDKLHTLALERYLDELNAELDDVRLELKPYSNEGDATLSMKWYEEIAANNRVLAVIDNTWGADLQSVASFIRENKIPVISMNADKGDTDFLNNVVFIGHDDDVPKYITAFSAKFLKNSKIIFIAEEDYALTNSFRKEINSSPIKDRITAQLFFNSKTIQDEERKLLFERIDIELARIDPAQKEPVAIILNTHATEGVKIIDHIDSTQKRVVILGGPFIVDWSKPGQFGRNDDHGNTLIMITTPSDAILNKVYLGLKDISSADAGVSQIVNAELFVKRCLNAIELIRGVFDERSAPIVTSAKSRSDFISFFQKKLKGKVYIGKDDLYEFDDNLLLVDEKAFEQRSQGEVLSYSKQLNSLMDEVPNVYFGLELINISNIDTEKRSFHADFFYWLQVDKDDVDKDDDVKKYLNFRNARVTDKIEEEIVNPNQSRAPSPINPTTQQPIPSENADDQIVRKVVNPNQSPPSLINPTTQQPIPSENADDQIVRKVYKMSADFSMDVDFGKYPLDTQELKIEVGLLNPANRLRISFDQESFKHSKKRVEEFSLDEWYTKDKDFHVTVDNFVGKSLLDRSSLENKTPQRFKTLNVRIPIHRHWTNPFVTIFLPLIMMGLAAIALLYVKDSSFSNLGEVCVGIFLSIVTYSIAFAQITPRSDVLTIADVLFYGTFFTIFLVFLKVIILDSSMISERVRSWTRDRTTLIGSVALTGYSLMIVVIFISGLT